MSPSSSRSRTAAPDSPQRRDPPVVTGLGVVSACGLGAEPLAAALAAGEPRPSPMEPLEGWPGRRRSTTAARVEVADYGDLLSRREARRMSPPSVFAVAAARMALADAGLPGAPDASSDPVPDPDCAVVLATAYGPSSFTQRMMDQILEEGPESLSPFLFMESVANAPAGQVAILCRAGGPNHTLCQREAGPLAALGRAAAEVAAGRARRALAGATEEMTPLLHAVLDRFGALSDRPRPFGRDRDGFLAAEGSTVLVVEPEGAARRRLADGAGPGRIRARLRGWGSAFDPTAPAAGWGRGGAQLARAVAAGLARAGLTPGDLDAVVSGASGSRRGDRLEAALLTALFGDAAPPVLVPKGVTGEYGGAPLAAALLALEGHPVALPAACTAPDPELGVVPAASDPDRPPGRLLVLSTAAGGGAAWGILESPEISP